MTSREVQYEFGEFGKNMYYLGICTLLCVVPFFTELGAVGSLIFTIMALGNLKRINHEFNDPRLTQFRTFYITVFITLIVGFIAMIISITSYFLFMPFLHRYAGVSSAGSIAAGIFIFLSSIIVALTLEMVAWTQLNSFLKKNQRIFPEQITSDTIKGTQILKIYDLVAILFIVALIITIAIGIVLFTVFKYSIYNHLFPLIGIIIIFLVLALVLIVIRSVGLLKLGKLRLLFYPPISHPYSKQAYPQKTQASQEPIKSIDSSPNLKKPIGPPKVSVPPSVLEYNFCPNCGNKLTIKSNFCPSCGVEFK